MESNLSGFLRELGSYLLGLGAIAFPFLMIDIFRAHGLLLRIRADNPDWRFNYSFAEYCTFLVPLAICFLVVSVQIQKWLNASIMRDDASLSSALAMIACGLTLMGMLRGKLKHSVSGEPGSAVLPMLGAALFSAFAGTFIILFFKVFAKVYG